MTPSHSAFPIDRDRVFSAWATLTVVPSATTSSLYGLNGSAANAFTIVGFNTPNVLRKL